MCIITFLERQKNCVTWFSLYQHTYVIIAISIIHVLGTTIKEERKTKDFAFCRERERGQKTQKEQNGRGR